MLQQRGVALLVVLVLTGLCAILLTGISWRHQLDSARSERVLVQEQAILLALSAESWARKILRDDLGQNDIDSLQDDWAQAIPLLPVDGGTLTGCMRDLQGRINLNNLAGYNLDRWQEDMISLAANDLTSVLNLWALLELDASEMRAADLIDWIDADQDSILASSAEDGDYLLEQPPRLTGGQPLATLEELASVRGFSAHDVAVLRPYATALPRPTAVNVNTASPEVLAAISSLFDPLLIELVLEARPFASSEEFFEFLQESLGYLTMAELQTQLPPVLFTVRTEWFELLATVDLLGQRIHLRSLLHRPGSGSVDVLMRHFQPRPTVIYDEQTAIVSSFDCASSARQSNDL